MPGLALTGPSGAQLGGDATGASGSWDSSVPSALLRPRGKAEPPPVAAGTRRGPALRAAAAAASPRRAAAGPPLPVPEGSWELVGPGGGGGGGRCSPTAAGPRGRGAGAAGDGGSAHRGAGHRHRPPGTAGCGVAPDRAGPLGPSARPAASPAQVYRPTAPPCAWGFSRGDVFLVSGVGWGIAVNSRRKRIDSDKITYCSK